MAIQLSCEVTLPFKVSSIPRQPSSLSTRFFTKGSKSNGHLSVRLVTQAAKSDSGSTFDGFDESAMEMMEKLLHGLVSEGMKSDVGTYNQLLEVLCKQGEMEKAVKFVNKMVNAEIEPDVVTYSNIVDGFCRKGEMEKAEEFVHEMVNAGIKPEVVTYTAIVEGLIKEGKMEMSRKFVSDLIDMGIKPNLDFAAYITLADEFYKNGDEEMAAKIVQEMVNVGIKPKFVSYKKLVEGLIKEGVAEERIEELVNQINEIVSENE